jgi:transposase InsO family protein
VSVRTLQRWEAAGPKREGRPPHAAQARQRALWACGRELRRQGWSAGWRPVAAARPDVPVRLVQRCVSALKQRRARVHERRIAGRRMHVEVLFPGVLAAQDATHLGRMANEQVSGELLRDVASERTLMLSVGRAAAGADAQRLFEETCAAGIDWPLVYSTDNGGEYCAEPFERVLREQQVVHLRNLPRTPQHNAWAERAIGEIKGECSLGKGVHITPESASVSGNTLLGLQERLPEVSQGPVRPREAGATSKISSSEVAVPDLDAVRARLQGAWWRLDHCRRRPRLGWRTAAQAYENSERWYTRVSRERFYSQTCLAIQQAVQGCTNPRAKRMAEREAIFQSLESFGLIRRTRGVRPSLARGGDRFS